VTPDTQPSADTLSLKDISRRGSRKFWRLDEDFERLVLRVGSHEVEVYEVFGQWMAGYAASETKAEAIKYAEKTIVEALGFAPWAKAHAWKYAEVPGDA
jgi:hypothetical protein